MKTLLVSYPIRKSALKNLNLIQTLIVTLYIVSIEIQHVIFQCISYFHSQAYYDESSLTFRRLKDDINFA